MKTILHLLGVLAMLLASPANAAALEAPSAAETRQMLLQGKYADLDQRFGAMQSAYVAGKITDEDLRAAFRAFYDPDISLEPAYTNWVAHSPKSYAAHLARGIYYEYRGDVLRGDKFSSETTEKQFADMRAAHAVAVREFEASLKLDPKPLLTYLYHIDIYASRGDLVRARELFDKGVSMEPKTFILREMYLGALQSMWGGSTAQMREFVEECRSAGLSQNQMARLHSIVLEDEAWVLQFRAKDLDAAAAAYGKAALLNPVSSCYHCEPSYRRVEIFAQQNEHAKTIKAASELLQKYPDDIGLLDMRGYAYLMLRKGPETEADLLRSAKLGDTWAQILYAKLLLSGYLVTVNRDEAIKWLRQAEKATKPTKEDDEIFVLLGVALNPKGVLHFTPEDGPSSP